MYPDEHESTHSQVTRRVRRNAGSAGIAAALLLFFGFYYIEVPTGGDLFAIAGSVFVYTLRTGGVAMAVLALWSLAGHPYVLVVDAVVSVLIGALLALTGLGMLIGGGHPLQPIISFVCGLLFVSAGVHNWREYASVTGRRSASSGSSRGEYDPRFEKRYRESQAAPPPASLASRLHDRLQESKDALEPLAPGEASGDAPPLSPVPDDSRKPPGPPSEPTHKSDESPDKHKEEDTDQPADGFLAGFADEEPPHRP